MLHWNKESLYDTVELSDSSVERRSNKPDGISAQRAHPGKASGEKPMLQDGRVSVTSTRMCWRLISRREQAVPHRGEEF